MLLFLTKALAAIIGLVLAPPCVVLGYMADYLDRYSEVSLLVSRIPFYIGEYTRLFYYKCTLSHVGKSVCFKYGSFCQYRTTSLGNRVLIGYYGALGQVHIGDDVLVGGFVNFISGTRQHSFAPGDLDRDDQRAHGRRTIHVGSGVWIGSNCLIAADIGDRSVIGAGSVLVRPADSNSVYAGNPAKCIRKLS